MSTTSVGCPICNNKQIAHLFLIATSEVAECPRCLVRFLRPQPSDRALADIYTADYFLGDQDGIAASEVTRLKAATASLYLQQILSLRNGNPGTLLEIGSGTGDFLATAQSEGFSVQGIEFSANAVEAANSRLGANLVQQGEIETALLPPNFFDIVFFSDVIEHVRDPVRFISRVRRCLKPGGLVYIVTPSTDSWSHKLMGRYWMEYKLEHLYYFNRMSLGQLLRNAKFDELRLSPNYKVLSFDYIHAHFRRFRVTFWSDLVHLFSFLVPNALSRKEWHVVASGVIATALKAKDDPS